MKSRRNHCSHYILVLSPHVGAQVVANAAPLRPKVSPLSSLPSHLPTRSPGLPAGSLPASEGPCSTSWVQHILHIASWSTTIILLPPELRSPYQHPKAYRKEYQSHGQLLRSSLIQPPVKSGPESSWFIPSTYNYSPARRKWNPHAMLPGI